MEIIHSVQYPQMPSVVKRTRDLPRVSQRPSPSDWADEEPLTLQEAVAVFFPLGPLTISSLRTEIRKGNLRAAKVAGRLYVTPCAMRALFEVRQWLGQEKALASTCAPAGSITARGAKSRPSISSETAKQTSALAAARSALQKLR
nr:hypothetical protein [Brevundimonas diminuta]